jgi:RNA polymerase sigma-70 factor (ECF subfamily)
LARAPETDADLVRRLRAGDQEAWEAFVDRFSRYVFAIATRAYRLSEHDAEDVFQDVFARAYTGIASLRDDNALRSWLGQLTRRLCVDRHRAGTREDLSADVEAEAEETIVHLHEALDVHDALATLSDECREVVDRFFCQDQSYRQIGDALGIPSGTIASRISRCLARLREQLSAD